MSYEIMLGPCPSCKEYELKTVDYPNYPYTTFRCKSCGHEFKKKMKKIRRSEWKDENIVEEGSLEGSGLIFMTKEEERAADRELLEKSLIYRIVSRFRGRKK